VALFEGSQPRLTEPGWGLYQVQLENWGFPIKKAPLLDLDKG